MIKYDLPDKIIEVLCNRNGFDGWWDNLDSEIKDEIKNEIGDVVKLYLRSGGLLD